MARYFSLIRYDFLTVNSSSDAIQQQVDGFACFEVEKI